MRITTVTLFALLAVMSIAYHTFETQHKKQIATDNLLESVEQGADSFQCPNRSALGGFRECSATKDGVEKFYMCPSAGKGKCIYTGFRRVEANFDKEFSELRRPDASKKD